MEENNKQKFELLKPNEDLKNDIQTIKQLLLTRQASSVLVPEKEKEEQEEEVVPSPAPGVALKPWEQRRRARLETSPPNPTAALPNAAATSSSGLEEEGAKPSVPRSGSEE